MIEHSSDQQQSHPHTAAEWIQREIEDEQRSRRRQQWRETLRICGFLLLSATIIAVAATTIANIVIPA